MSEINGLSIEVGGGVTSYVKPKVGDLFAGMDVGLHKTYICVLDRAGQKRAEGFVTTDPPEIVAFLRPFRRRLRLVGHEVGSQSPWLQKKLVEEKLPAICLEAVHVRAALKAQRNKTDKNDAEGIAHVTRTGWFKTVYAKSEDSHRVRLMLRLRQNLKQQCLDIENSIRGSLQVFGIRIGLGRPGFEQKVRRAVAADAFCGEMMDAMLRARAAIWEQFVRLEKMMLATVSKSDISLRLLGIPGVGPVTALTFVSGIDDPSRFRRSRSVGAYLGLTPRRRQSGTSIDVNGRISRAGDLTVRSALWKAASTLMTRYTHPDRLREWGLSLSESKGHGRASVAVARRLSVIMHAMWARGTAYDGGEGAVPQDLREKLRLRSVAI